MELAGHALAAAGGFRLHAWPVLDGAAAGVLSSPLEFVAYVALHMVGAETLLRSAEPAVCMEAFCIFQVGAVCLACIYAHHKAHT